MFPDTPTLGEFDVVVVDAGSAGATAAISAARAGASVALVDRHGFLGGTSTAVLDTFYGFYTPGEQARKIVGGIPDDVVAGLRSLGEVVERPNSLGLVPGLRIILSTSKWCGRGLPATPESASTCTRLFRNALCATGTL